jgi:hypothetical protein
MLNVVILSVVMLNAVILSVVILSVVAPNLRARNSTWKWKAKYIQPPRNYIFRPSTLASIYFPV